MGRAPNRRDLGPTPGPDAPKDAAAGKIQSRKPVAPPHGKKPMNEPIQAIADKVTGIGARSTPGTRRPAASRLAPPAPPRPMPSHTRAVSRPLSVS